MTCPRCGNEWDVSKSPCSRCGLLVHLPGRSNSAARNNLPPLGKQQTNGSRPLTSSGGMLPTPPASISRNPRETGTPSRPLPQGQNPGSFPPLPKPAPITPRPSGPSIPEQKSSNSRPQQGQSKDITMDMLSKTVPGRPQTQFPTARSTDNLAFDIRSPVVPMRPTRSTTGPLTRDGHWSNGTLSQSYSNGSVMQNTSSLQEGRALIPGTLLRGGRYRLREIQERQEWLTNVSETMWVAQDAQRSGSKVMICELVMPDTTSIVMQSTLRAATIALTSA